jgi:hypothetical protein
MSYIFSPNKSAYESSKLDEKSSLCIGNILINQNVKNDVWYNNNYPNIDGYIEILDDNGIITGKVTIQAKTMKEEFSRDRKYPIPSYVLGYAERILGEVVILLVVDYKEKKIFWKYISREYINLCIEKGSQQSFTYHFSDKEILTESNAAVTIKTWQKLFDEKMSSLKDVISDAMIKIANLSLQFQSINEKLSDPSDTHIEREELNSLFNWINSPLEKGGNNLALLIGSAGTGKSAILKELLIKLKDNDIPFVAIKADMYKITNDKYNLEDLCNTIGYLSSNREKVVLVIDQIDALSQNLANDRENIKNYLALINNFIGIDSAKDIRIIVSCRKFDLEYDPALSTLKNYKIFELKGFSEDNVKKVLSILNKDLPNQVSSSTIDMLRTPQYLDIYCKIYRNDTALVNYNTSLDLYDELWKLKVLEYDNSPGQNKLDEFLYSVAKKMQEEETLYVNWIENTNNHKYISYIGSQGLAYYKNNKIHFFHQSFYDYVLARYYTENSISITKYIISMHQGLFLRSTTKIMVDYLRGHDIRAYKTEVSSLLTSTNIRLHLKLLVLDVIASQEKVIPWEKKAIGELMNNQKELFFYFISRIHSVQWFENVKYIIIDYIHSFSISNKFYSYIMSFLINCVKHNTATAFLIIDNIEDEKSKREIAKRILWFTTDYSVPSVQKWFLECEEELMHDGNEYLENAIKTNLPFALDIIRKKLNRIIEKKKDTITKHYDEVFMDEVLGPLGKEHPLELYPIIKEFVLKVIDLHKFKYISIYIYKNNVFYGLDTEDTNDKIPNLVIKILCDEIDHNSLFVKNEVAVLLNSVYETSIIIALQVMDYYPKLFVNELIEKLRNIKLIDEYFDFKDIEYYFLTLMKHSYTYFNDKQKQWFQNYIYNFKSSKDLIPDKDRKIFPQLYFNLGYRQRKLIYTIQSSDLDERLKRLKGELDRRFPEKYENQKPEHAVTMAYFCGGVTSHAKYKTFSKKIWLNSFLKLDENKYNFKKDRHPININVHADEFESCISEKADYYFDFVDQILKNANVTLVYKLAGLSGLVKGGIKATKLFKLYMEFLKVNLNERFSQRFFDITKYMLADESIEIDDILRYLIHVIKTDVVSIYDMSIEDAPIENDERVNNLLTEGINMIQGKALDVLISACAIKNRQARIYKILSDLYPILCIELRLVVLYRIYAKEYYNEEIFPDLLKLYLSEPVSSYILVQSEAIHHYWHDDPQVVNPYVISILHHKHSQEILSQLMFWGTNYELSKELSIRYLNDILKDNDENVISTLVEMSIKNIKDKEYESLSKHILDLFIKDARGKVVSTYLMYCEELPVDYFYMFEQWFDSLYNALNERSVSYIINYLKKSATTYPQKCFNYLNRIIAMDKFNYSYERKDMFELLLSIYKYLKDEDDFETMEKIMNTFDSMMLVGNQSEIREILNKIEN